MFADKEMREVFLNELRELLSSLNKNLILLEEYPSHTKAIDEITRIVHTLKGLFAATEFVSIARVCHIAEDALIALSKTGFVDSDSLDILFTFLNRLEELLGFITKGKGIEEFEGFDFSPLMKELETLSLDSLNLGRTYRMVVHFDDRSTLKGARAFQVLTTLENIAKITEAKPSKLEIEEGIVFSSLEVIFISQEEKKIIQEHVELVDEVAQVQLEMLVETLEVVQLKDKKRGPAREAEPSSIQSVRVQLAHLDQMMNLVGELVITRNAMTQLLDLSGPQSYLFNEMDKTILELRTLILKTRLVPLQYIYEHYPRLVREATKGSNKKINLMLGGKDLEVDRTVIDYLNEALIHLIRNSVNHGIEDTTERERLGKSLMGKIELKAQIERNDILISIEDDGRGIDLDSVRKKAIEQGFITQETELDHDGIIALLFLSGFSTSEKLTDLSGRGIGMTIVYNNVVEKMNGTLSVDTEKGVGTLITIRLPRSIAIMEALIVRADSREVAIPMGNIFRVYQIQDRQVFYHNERPFVVVNKEIIPVLSLGDTFEDDSEKLEFDNSESLESSNKAVIIWERAGKKIGVLVDAILAQQQIVLKKMDKLLSQVKGFSGVTLMGEGTLIPVIDPTQLVGGV